jgi:hypothetical protein
MEFVLFVCLLVPAMIRFHMDQGYVRRGTETNVWTCKGRSKNRNEKSAQ